MPEQPSRWSSGRSDEELGMRRPITRRDFLDGAAIAVGGLAIGGLAGGDATAAAATAPAGGTPYPPALQGMRGYTDASMVVPHKLRDGTFWRDAGRPRPTGEHYDLVVVGGGLSGLAAARFYQREFGHDARILILDALDDFGGHARRNEYETTGRTLVGYGGSQSLDTPSTFNAPAKWLLEDLDIEVQRFERYFDQGFNARFGLTGRALLFDKESWGRDHYVAYAPGTKWADIVKDAPMAARAKADLAAIYDAPADWLPGMTDGQKKDVLAGITYGRYLTDHVKAHPDAVKFIQSVPNGYWGYGADAVGALDASLSYAGFDGLNLNWDRPDRRIAPTGQKLWGAEDEYIYHFPEGNGGVARALVRRLIPDALPGHGMESIPTARLRYDRLDHRGNRVRIRLGAPVVRVRHDGHPRHARRVEVAYVRSGALHQVHARHAVLACNNQMIPYLTEELPEEQRDALKYAGRLALMYANVQIRDWTAFTDLKISGVRFPTMYWDNVSLDFPVSMGRYRFPDDPGDPMILHMGKAVCEPGLEPREQGKAGRRALLSTTFADMERAIRDQLGRALGPGGFDPARDIEGITVNRWSHGYAYEYGRPWDTFWPDGELPSHTARRRFGRVAVANTDSAPRAYADSAIDMGYRAVRDLAGKPSDEVSRGVDGVAP